MQINETKPYDARSFSQICAGIMHTPEGDDLRETLIRRTGSCARTVDNWMQGKTAPINSKIKLQVAKIIGDRLAIRTNPTILFSSNT